jgi:predicted double-glycine peptidase
LKGASESRNLSLESKTAAVVIHHPRRINLEKRMENSAGLVAAFAFFTSVFLFFLLIGGCAKCVRTENQSAIPSFQTVSHFIRVPLTRQSRDYTCGVAALQSVLYYYGEEFREDELVQKLQPTPEKGTKYTRMVSFAKSLNFHVEIFTGMTLTELQKWIDEKKPVIVAIQAWAEKPVNYVRDWDDGHYVVAIGYDQHNLYFMDPSILGHYAYLPTSEFINRWHDRSEQIVLNQFGMIISRGPPTYHYDEIKLIK